MTANGSSFPLSNRERELYEKSLAVKQQAYCPYSNFRVGAVVETTSGELFSGCNVENASYPAGICAERVAIGAAVSAGHRKFTRIVITSDSDEPTPPCGICRQLLVEFPPDFEVVAVTNTGKSARWMLTQLLPSPFTPASLKE